MLICHIVASACSLHRVPNAFLLHTISGCATSDVKCCRELQDKQQLQLVMPGADASELSATCEVCTFPPTAYYDLCAHFASLSTICRSNASSVWGVFAQSNGFRELGGLCSCH